MMLEFIGIVVLVGCVAFTIFVIADNLLSPVKAQSATNIDNLNDRVTKLEQDRDRLREALKEPTE